jgi:NADH-quinone oxidoreductase subunit L
VAMGWLAISGVPLLSGFFSKDAILSSAYTTNLFGDVWPKVLWAVGLLTALLTAIYMTRLMVLTFWGPERFKDQPAAASEEADSHGASAADHGAHSNTPHESPMSMVLPLVVLAIGAVFAGYLNIPKGFLPESLRGGSVAAAFDRVIEPSIAAEGTKIVGDHFEAAAAPAAEAESGVTEIVLAAVSSLVAIGGILIGWVWFTRQPLWEAPRIIEEKYKVDEAYDVAIVEPIKALSTNVLWKIIDVRIIDGAVNSAGKVAELLAGGLRFLQGGLARAYIAMVVLGALLMIGYFVIR